MKNDIPVAGVRPPGRDLPLRHRPRRPRCSNGIAGARVRQPLRRRHERFPEYRRGEPGAHGHGERDPRGRPAARTHRLTSQPGARRSRPAARSRLPRATSGPWSSDAGGGLRAYSAGGRELLDGSPAGTTPRSGRGQVLIPWPNRLEDGRYEFDGRRHQLPLTEPEHRNAIHGLVRSESWARRRTGTAPRGDGAHAPPPARLSVHARAAHRVRALRRRAAGDHDRDEHRRRGVPVRGRCASVL